MQYIVHNSSELCKVLKQSGDKKIILKKGDYEVEHTLVLESNTEITAENGVNVYGSKRIFLDGLKKEKGIYKISLEEYGIKDFGEFGQGPYKDYWKEYDIPKPHMDDCGPSLELYMGSRKMNISRYPEKGFMKLKDVVGETRLNDVRGYKCTEEGKFIPEDKKIFEKNSVSDMLLVGYWTHDWATQRHTVKSFDKKSGVVEINGQYHVYGYTQDRGHFYVINVKSQVKKPGDWYIDKAKGEIYFIPYKNQKYVDVTVCENLFEAKDAENIKIENLNISRCRKSAIHFENCKSIEVKGCCIKNVGAWAVIADNCAYSIISECTVSYTGGGGIACSGGDRNTLTPSGNKVISNTISNIAYWHKTYLSAIEINGVGVNVAFNKIFDVPHFAIVFQGNDHIMENNDIKNACYESNDAGAIYAGRDYTCRGNIIRYNYLHDMPGYEGKGCIGVYFDDGMCSAEVYGNIFSNLVYTAILLGGGRDFNIHHNSFYNCKRCMCFDNRMETWPSGNTRQLKHLYEVPYRSEVWKNAYSELYNLLDDEPKAPKNNKFTDNTVIGGYGISVTDTAIGVHLERKNNIYIDGMKEATAEWEEDKAFIEV